SVTTRRCDDRISIHRRVVEPRQRDPSENITGCKLIPRLEQRNFARWKRSHFFQNAGQSLFFRDHDFGLELRPVDAKRSTSNDGGEGGIRTLGTLLGYGALAKRCFRPLSHLTNWLREYGEQSRIANSMHS